VHITDEVWELLTAPGASLAFSYYSRDAAQHNAEADGAREDLRAIGITKIGTDRIRAVGRGGNDGISELCGRCGKGVAAISPDGDVWPCVFSRWMPVGNVLASPLAEIMASRAMTDAVASIPNNRRSRCDPDGDCTPGVPPSSCTPRT
jgi:MoaA/NifB/PqqE/SkfB family radical SAM enzyme